IALAIGWRWAFLVGAIVAISIAIWISLRRCESVMRLAGNEKCIDHGMTRGGLAVLTIGAGFAAATSTSLGIFLVNSAIELRMAASTAGLLFAAAASLGLVIR